MLNIKSSVMLAIMTVSRMLTALCIGKAMAVVHGAAGLGLLGHLQGITGLVAGLLAAPLGNGLIRAVAAEGDSPIPDRSLTYWQEALRVSAWIATILIAVLLLFYQPIISKIGQDGISTALIIVAVGVAPFQALATAFQSLLNGLGKLRELAGLGIVGTLAVLAISVLGLVYQKIEQGLTVVLFAVALQAVVFIFYFRSTPWIRGGLLKKDDRATEIRKDIGSFALMAIVTAALIPGVQIVIRSFLAKQWGWEMVGYWQAAQRLSDAHLSLLGTILSTQMLPKLVKTNTSQIGSSILKGTALSGIFLVPGALVLLLFGDYFVHLLFSDDLQDSVKVFKYQIGADFLRALSWPASYFLIAKARLASFCIAEAIFATVWAGGTFALNHKYGWEAASVGYLIASAASLIFVTASVWSQLKK